MATGNLVGTVKATGLYDPRIQNILRHHCERGSIIEMAEVVAQVLYDESLVVGSMPQPSGIRTRSLEERAEDGARKLATQYARRGVVCAKGYYSPSQLALLIFNKWSNALRSVLEEPGPDPDVIDTDHKDFVARSTVSAQALLALLQKLQRTPEGDFIIPMSAVEGFCMASTRTVHRAFTDTDIVVHELVHGETPTTEM